VLIFFRAQQALPKAHTGFLYNGTAVSDIHRYRQTGDDIKDLQPGRGRMPGVGPGKILLHMRLGEMVIEMLTALPLFDKMKEPGSSDIGEQFIAGASGFPANNGDDLPDLPDKITAPFRHNGTFCIDE
jgi:hypothetical protein